MCLNLVKISIGDNSHVESTLCIKLVNPRDAKEPHPKRHKQVAIQFIRKAIHGLIILKVISYEAKDHIRSKSSIGNSSNHTSLPALFANKALFDKLIK